MLVQKLHRKIALRHPAREVRNASDIVFIRVDRITALIHIRNKRVKMGRKRAINQPRLGRGMKGRNRVYGGHQ